MFRPRMYRKVALLAAAVSVGSMFNGNCMNLALSITPCGTIFPLTVCTPVDQVNLLFPLLEIPDFRTDPSCTIPLGCDTSDVLPPLVGGPGGGPSDPPTGGTGGGGGGGT
ncbi:MAG: hypothetical protein L6Q92_15470 [Phycisphaerae bacterium]|nr:hypothetical protein [Phycisphaerae bacterium]